MKISRRDLNRLICEALGLEEQDFGSSSGKFGKRSDMGDPSVSDTNFDAADIDQLSGKSSEVDYDKESKKAKGWDSYIASGKSESSKMKRTEINGLWERMAGNPEFGHPNDKVLPGAYSKDYSDWVKWYKVIVQKPAVMSLIGKESTGRASVDDVVEILKDVEKNQYTSEDQMRKMGQDAEKALDTKDAHYKETNPFDLDPGKLKEGRYLVKSRGRLIYERYHRY